MIEVHVRDENLDEVLLSFDGRVFELFTPNQSSAVRVHIGMMVLRVGEPDRKGRVVVDIAPVTPGNGGARLVFDQEQFQIARPLIAQIETLLPKTG